MNIQPVSALPGCVMRASRHMVGLSWLAQSWQASEPAWSEVVGEATDLAVGLCRASLKRRPTSGGEERASIRSSQPPDDVGEWSGGHRVCST
jgi:hypothetical protein